MVCRTLGLQALNHLFERTPTVQKTLLVLVQELLQSVRPIDIRQALVSSLRCRLLVVIIFMVGQIHSITDTRVDVEVLTKEASAQVYGVWGQWLPIQLGISSRTGLSFPSLLRVRVVFHFLASIGFDMSMQSRRQYMYISP